MAVISNVDLALGTQLPDFELEDVRTGKPVKGAHGSKGALVLFICNHCPYVIHLRSKLVEVAHHAIDQGIAVYAINSNDTEAYPQDAPSFMAAWAKEDGFRFPFLFDATQEVAKRFKAACTPDIFLFGKKEGLFYHGQFDSSRPKNSEPVTGADLKSAIDDLAFGRPLSHEVTPCMGCSIKWRQS